MKRLYAAAVDHLFGIGYQVTDAEYQKLRNSVEEARVQVEIYGLRVAEHEQVGVHSGVHSKAG